MKLKIELFTEVAKYAPAGALFASNTSSLSVTEMAAASGRPARFAGMHFFNPVHVMKLLELVRGLETSDATVEALREVGERMGKEVVVVRDFPGFATSRLGLVIGLEAIRMVEQGAASAADIDTAMKLGYGHPMGPLELTDLVGLDVRLGIAEYLAGAIGPGFAPPALLRRLVGEGKLGKKSGEGFYRWVDGKKPRNCRNLSVGTGALETAP